MNIIEGLRTLWDSTGIMGFVHSAQSAMADPNLEGVEQILHMHGQWIMILICLFLLWLGIKKQFEPLLLVPIAFGGLLSNIPMPLGEEIAGPNGFLGIIFEAGIHKGLFPLIIFMGVGAMTDFGPLIANPKTALLGGAAQFGIFGALLMAYCMFGFTMPEAASIGIIGGADGPTSIYVTSKLAENLLGPIAVAAYSYMALVPVIQPPIMKLLTTKAERKIKMTQLREVSKREKIVFPLMILLLCVIFLPSACPLLGALCFGNLCKECGVVERLSDTMHIILNEVQDTYNIEFSDYIKDYMFETECEDKPYDLDVINYYKDIRNMYDLTLSSTLEKLNLELPKTNRNIFDELADKITS